MRLPHTLVALTDQGIIEEVVRPLKSGKEAQVYLVVAGGQERIAKVYKDSEQRSFKNRSQYTEGRRVRNSRDQRAISKRTRHGRTQDEAAWKSAEVDVIYRLHAAGVRVPEPYNFIDDVLIMELVRDGEGQPAPRLAELTPDPDWARAIFDQLLREVVKMLSAGIVHGDLSDYNVLVDENGPVVIDFPQSVDASRNRNARDLLMRDVDNLTSFLSRFVPNARRRPYGQELWAAYENNTLSPEMELTGRWKRSQKKADMSSLLYEIEAAEEDERRRREKLGEAMPTPRRREVVMSAPSAEPSSGRRNARPKNERGPKGERRAGTERGRAAGSTRTGGSRGSESNRGESNRGESNRGESNRGESNRSASSPDAPRRRRRRRKGPGEGASAEGQPHREPNASPDGARAEPRRDERTGPPRDGEGAPKKRRRRRRRKPGADAPAQGASAQNSAQDSGSRSPRARSSSDRSTSDRSANDQRTQGGGRDGDGQGQSARREDGGDGEAGPKRRRRRRRRKPAGERNQGDSSTS